MSSENGFWLIFVAQICNLLYRRIAFGLHAAIFRVPAIINCAADYQVVKIALAKSL